MKGNAHCDVDNVIDINKNVAVMFFWLFFTSTLSSRKVEALPYFPANLINVSL